MKLEEQLRREIIGAGHAYNTEKAYLQNYRKFIQFIKGKYSEYRHPKELTKQDVSDFLTHLAADKNLAADTQRVALSALKFLYENVLDLDIGIVKFTLSTKPKKLPVVTPKIWATVLIFGCLFLFTSLANSAVNAQEDFEIGDRVELKFLGKTLEGEVIETGRSWPKIEFTYNGETRTQRFPPSRLTLLDEAASEAEEMPATTELTSEFREWSDSTGAFKIKAKLLSAKNGKIKLEKEDGFVVTLPSLKLSDADQKFIAELEKQKAMETSEDNPFAGGVKKSSGKGRSAGDSTRSSANKIEAIVPEVSSNEIALFADGWNVSPDSGGDESSTKKRAISTPTLYTKHAFHNRTSKVSFGPDNKFAALSRSNPFESGSEIVVLDLENAKSKAPLKIRYKDCTLLAISADGKTAVTFRKSEGRNPGYVDFWNLDNVAKRYASWKTATFFERDGFSPKSGVFLDEKRLLTIGKRVVLWDFETAAALYSVPLPKTAKIAFSANNKQIAIPSGDSVFVIDTDDGKVLGEIETPHPADVLAFSHSGNFLAGLAKTNGSIWVWDLAANELVQELSTNLRSTKSMVWVDDDYLLVGNSDLIDVELRASVWKYKPGRGASIIPSSDGEFWLSRDTKLSPLKLPHKPLKVMTAKFDPDSLLVLKPGVEVSLELDLPFAPAEQRNIRDRLVKNLESNNVTVRDGADLKLVAIIKKGQQKTSEVSGFFDHFGRKSETIKYTPNHASLVLKKKDAVVWGRYRTFGPSGMISTKEGETTQQAADRTCQPTPSFFTSVVFPKYIAVLPSGKPLGESTLGGR